MRNSTDLVLDDVAKTNHEGRRIAHIVIGEETDPSAPHMFWAKEPPGLINRPHAHATDYCEIIIEGTQRVGKKWYRPGEARLVKAGTGYGPLEAGPEGCTKIVIFATSAFEAIEKGAAKSRSANGQPG